MKYFKLDASVNDLDDYIQTNGYVEMVRSACFSSELQYLDRSVMYWELRENERAINQDFIFDHGVPLVSERVKDFFDECGIDYLFYKKIILRNSVLGTEEPYWIALPPRIDCLDMDLSEIDEDFGEATKIVIIDRYDIFKLAGVTNYEIIVTELLAAALKEQNFVGLHICQIK